MLAGENTKANGPAKACSCGRVDVHSHYLPDPYRAALVEDGIVHVDGGMPLPQWSPDAHLAMMDQNGIATSMLSISSPGLHLFERSKAIRVARAANQAGAELVRARPDKFGLFAALPLPDVDAAIAEVAHAYDTLHVDGVTLETNINGHYLGDPRFLPLFDALEQRCAVVFLHPTSPECLAEIGMGLPGPAIEFPFDTARSVVNLIYAGVLRKRPNIRLILSHAGGALPILMGRIASFSQAPLFSPRPENGATEVLEEVKRLYYDLAVSASPLNFQALVHISEISHILFGSDFPFAPPPAIAANGAAIDKILSGLSPIERRMVNHDNAVTLFPRLKALIAS